MATSAGRSALTTADDVAAGVAQRSDARHPGAPLVDQHDVDVELASGEHSPQLVVDQHRLAVGRALRRLLFAVDHDREVALVGDDGREKARRRVQVTHFPQRGRHGGVVGAVHVAARHDARMLGDVDPLGRLAGDLAGAGVQRGEIGEHAPEGVDQARVELLPAAALELGQAVGVGHGAAVGTPRRHGVVGVDDAHHLGEGRDVVAGEAVGVAGAVPAFVMVAHGGHELGCEQRADDVGAEAGMLAHELPLAGVQAAGLEQHAVGDRDLADVVQVGRLFGLHERLVRPAELLAEQHHVGGDAGGVTERVVVLGRERRAQGLEVAQVQAADAFVEAGVAQGQRQVGGDPAQHLDVVVRVGVRLLAAERERADQLALGEQAGDGARSQAGDDRVVGRQRSVGRQIEDQHLARVAAGRRSPA